VIYFVRALPDGPIKVGHSSNVPERLKQLQQSSPQNLAVIKTVEGGFAEERALHEKFNKYRLHGEWFSPHPSLINFIETCPESLIPPDLPILSVDEIDRIEEAVNEIGVETEDEEVGVATAANLLGVSPQTLRNWEREGKIEASRTDGGHRRYRMSCINKMRQIQMAQNQIIFSSTPGELMSYVESMLAVFDPLERVHITLTNDEIGKQTIVSIDAPDHGSGALEGLLNVTRKFKFIT
tara:strand:- start:3316 stop:4029 length:714 start_codon:yes stop_codon:yes gene_type:complete